MTKTEIKRLTALRCFMFRKREMPRGIMYSIPATAPEWLISLRNSGQVEYRKLGKRGGHWVLTQQSKDFLLKHTEVKTDPIPKTVVRREQRKFEPYIQPIHVAPRGAHTEYTSCKPIGMRSSVKGSGIF